MMQPKTIYDINRRPIMHGDICRMYHFTGANRRKVMMYKLVLFESSKLTRRKFFFGVCIKHIAEVGLAKAHRFLLSEDDGHEIIDGRDIRASGRKLISWWERPKKAR